MKKLNFLILILQKEKYIIKKNKNNLIILEWIWLIKEMNL
jgi:hypothetical protein